ncbi:hypothetical protein MIMGU_mgv1a019730mg [Erythranthe guttata]|uniref:Ribosomal protein L34Ae n=1 Tax=Erythranthe guttata TaxID=4155 RepID=A0A022R4W4_ERYGU|nr:hypothetical protein MIMGU_mgv1a019730mg [Erythranthe guttata]
MGCDKVGVLRQKIASFIHSVFSFISTYIFRLRTRGDSVKRDDGDVVFLEAEKDANEFRHLKFKFPMFEEISGNLMDSEAVPCAETTGKKYEFLSRKSSLTAFFEDLSTFRVKEINCDKIGNLFSDDDVFSENEAAGFGEIKEHSIQEEAEEVFLDEYKLCSEKNGDGFLSDGDFIGESDIDSENEKIDIREEDMHRSSESEFLNSDANKLESLWEHQELIEQLKMELKKVKATGLPTILEESESPKMNEELKPYTEKMRKFDILNYQKMYAMGFLQLKDPFQSTPQQKRTAPSLRSLVSQNLWLFKHKINGSDPIKKFINELHGDLEVVYVGQMCLSWEFLHYQYGKTLDLSNSDPNGIHRYNEVAGEFQQFQVLMQRFNEDEPFQGPRIQSYVKSRCVLRNLLQVPVVRGKIRKKDRDEYVITSEMLVEIVEESIRIFWNLVRSDKDCNVLAMKNSKKTPELQNPDDLKLLVDVRKALQKKERKLKDILRSENCILRKFRKSNEDDSDQALHFFAQVDMKLVSRVLNMSKITMDQLIWCRNKLSRISFVNRKINVESAFLLFPC